MKHALTLLATLAIVGFPLIGRAEEAAADVADLSLRLQPGDTYALTVTTDKLMNEWIANNESNALASTTLWLTMNVLDVADDGTTLVKLTFDRITLKTETEGDVSEYDSQNPGEELEYPLKMYQGLVGQSFQAKLSPAGEVLEVLESDALHKAVMNALSGGKSEIVINTMTSHSMVTALFGTSMDMDLMSLMGNKGLRRFASSLLFPRPGEPVAIGHTWPRDNDQPIDPSMKCTSTYKLDSRQDGVATVQIEGTIKHDPGSRGGKPVIVFSNMTTSMEGTRSGTLKLDEKSGLVTAARITDTIKGEVKPKESDEEDADAKAQGAISIAVGVDIVTTIECKRQAAVAH
jgi:hypothetical protein